MILVFTWIDYCCVLVWPDCSMVIRAVMHAYQFIHVYSKILQNSFIATVSGVVGRFQCIYSIELMKMKLWVAICIWK